MAYRTNSLDIWSNGVLDVLPTEPPAPDTTVPPLPVPDGPMLYSMPDYVSRNGQNHPATRSPIKTMYFRMTPAWSDYVWALQRLLNPSMSEADLLRNMKGLFNGSRAFDNGHGMESGDWALQNLYCAGATFELASDTIRVFQGRRWMRAKAIDWSIKPAIPQALADIEMCHHFFPTTATDAGNNPFPQFSGRCVIPWFGAERDPQYGVFNWVDIDGYPERPGPMIRVDRPGHPFVPARWDITQGLIDP